MYKLRPYQQAVKDAYKRGFDSGHLRQIAALGTGAGKTVLAANIIHEVAEAGNHSLFVVDRIELVQQAAATLQRMGLQVGILQGENTDMRNGDEVTVASIQTIRARVAPFANFIVIDECHILHKAHIQLMKDWFWIPVLGLSATPMRTDLGKYFTNLIRGPSIKELMDSGDLVRQVHAYCPGAEAMRKLLDNVQTRCGDFIEGQLSRAMNNKQLVGDIVRTWQEKASDRQTLCFAVDIAHSKAIVEDFRSEGIQAEHLDAYTPAIDRHRIIQAFRNHEVQILSSVNVLGIGFDVPTASCAILARPTLSEMLDMQQKGRVLRPADGKEDAIILDHAGNTLRFGLPQDFTVPDLTEEDRTSTKDKRKQKKAVACKECGYVLEPDQMTCPACGLDRQTRKAKVHYLDGRLVEFGDGSDGGEHHTQEQKLTWYLAFLWQARRRNRKDGWAFYAFQAKFNHKPTYNWRYYEPVVPSEEQARWIRHYEIRKAKSYQKSKWSGYGVGQ